ncbi:SusC/RagA family TonB-linked outer membrane protein [Bergeyella sp. RCAD1439]|uniref:SusC/RagA family TonB-linked outer membrane protein n=1 Tax=Bergeyella anatis TaxID=3113737 RepID=UPI002E188145|nr:SusC/RagA family TonB-linked outer membrane protein [Bergeyella sp. RCAD1439]
MKTGVFFLFLPMALAAQTRVSDTLERSKEIEQVVITGYQKIEKNKLTSAVSTVKMADIEQKGTASVEQMLQGKVAGVMINPASGTPGQIAPIRIRGTASLSGSVDPLWVLDGVPLEGNEAPKYNAGEDINLLRNYSIAGVNPEDIEDITILKDASATAIYGARAANGVIVVTTKKGKKGRLNINFSSNTFVNLRPNFEKLNLLNSNQKVDFELAMAGREDLDGYRSGGGEVMRILTANGDLTAYRLGGYEALSSASKAQIQALRGVNTRWGDLLYRAAVNQQQSINFSGGVDNYNYYASLGYYNEDAAVIGSGFDRFNVTLKNSFKFNQKLNLGITFFGVQTTRKSFLSDTGSFTTPTYYSRTANPYLAVRDADGNYIYDQDINYIERSNGTIVRLPFNYIEERENTRYDMQTRSARFIFDADYKILKGLEFRTQLGVLLENTHTERYAKQDTYFMRRALANSYQSNTDTYILPEGDYLNTVDDKGFEYNWKNVLQYRVNLGSHDLDFLVGNELRRVKTEGTNSQMYGYNPFTRTSVPLTIPSSQITNANYIPVTNYLNEDAYTSFYGTASYTFGKKYTLFGSLRYDGTNLFGAELRDKYLPVWAVSGAWNVKREGFLADNTTISTLKLRGSYGLQGNIDRNTSKFFVGSYRPVRLLNTTENMLIADTYPNERLRWEKTTNINLGLDFGLFNNRLNFVFDLYHRKGTDIVGVTELPQESGVDFATINWAGITNRGFEFSVSSVNVDTGNFTWSTAINIAANRSNIDQIMARNNQFTPSGLGYPVNAVFGIKTAGLDENGMPLFYGKDGSVVNAVDFLKLSNPYDFFWPDYVQSSLSDVESRGLYSYLGDRDPKFYGGINNTFRMKNWDLNIATTFNLRQYVKGRPTYNFTAVDRGLNYSSDVLHAGNGRLPRIVGAETLPSDRLTYNWFYPGNDYMGIYNNLDIWNKEISFIRISSIRLGYSVPQSVLKSTGIASMRLSLEGRNLLTFGTNTAGYFDPETYGNIYATPVQKSVILGFNIGF